MASCRPPGPTRWSAPRAHTSNACGEDSSRGASFDAVSSTRPFVLAMSDIGETVSLSPPSPNTFGIWRRGAW